MSRLIAEFQAPLDGVSAAAVAEDVRDFFGEMRARTQADIRRGRELRAEKEAAEGAGFLEANPGVTYVDPVVLEFLSVGAQAFAIGRLKGRELHVHTWAVTLAGELSLLDTQLWFVDRTVDVAERLKNEVLSRRWPTLAGKSRAPEFVLLDIGDRGSAAFGAASIIGDRLELCVVSPKPGRDLLISYPNILDSVRGGQKLISGKARTVYGWAAGWRWIERLTAQTGPKVRVRATGFRVLDSGLAPLAEVGVALLRRRFPEGLMEASWTKAVAREPDSGVVTPEELRRRVAVGRSRVSEALRPRPPAQADQDLRCDGPPVERPEGFGFHGREDRGLRHE